MNIEISDDMIENIARDLIKDRVRQFFSMETNKDFIKKLVNSEVQRVVRVELNNKKIDINRIADAYISDDLFRLIASQISEDIAAAYAYKYGD